MLYHAVPNHPQIEKLILYNLSGIWDSPPCGCRDAYILYHKTVRLSNPLFEIWTLHDFKGHLSGEKDTQTSNLHKLHRLINGGSTVYGGQVNTVAAF